MLYDIQESVVLFDHNPNSKNKREPKNWLNPEMMFKIIINKTKMIHTLLS